MNFRMALLAGLLAVSGCTTIGLGNARIGGAAGAVAGDQPEPSSGEVTATIIAAMNGGLIGGEVGDGLDDRDRRIALEAEYRALEYTQGGQPVPWKSERSGRYGTVVAAQPYRVGSQDCRQYTHAVYNRNRSQTARGTACRNADGSWTPLT